MGKLEGKSAIVLGAATAGNIGQVIARVFASEGARVMVSGRNEATLAELSKDIGGHYALCDITRHDDLKSLAVQTKSAFGRIDIAVNAVGWGLSKSVTDIEDAELEKIVAVQFTGVHHFLAEMVRGMMDNDPAGGSIIQISSATTQALINNYCLLYTSPSPRDQRGSRMPSSA